MNNQTLNALGLGLSVGFVCIGGLALGFRLIFRAQEQSSYKALHYLFAAFILVFQFFFAIFLLWKTPWIKSQPIFVGLGIVVSIFVGSFLLNTLTKINKK